MFLAAAPLIAEGGAAAATAGVASAGAVGSIAATAAEAASIAAGASALYSMTQKPKINTPPMPTTPQATIDEQAQSAEQEAKKRAASGGLQSTTGTPGGQAGTMLNPATVSQHTLLGG